MNDDSLLVIAGATATGKSVLALRLAEEQNGEIISADSMQLYRGLDIGTAKPSPEERKRVRHHLIDVLDLRERADVFAYVKMADAAIAEIRGRGHRPILAGGSGFYLKSLLYSLDDLPSDVALRKSIDAEFDSPEQEPILKSLMQELDSEALAKFSGNRRKLLRALEVKRLTGRSLLSFQSHTPKQRYEFEGFILDWEREELKRRIASRTEAMLKAGWIEETRTLISQGLLESPTARQALGYPIIAEFLAGRIPAEDLPSRIATATWQFARRQITYFRHQLPLTFLSCGKEK